jgi:Bifunctional DNA primase/polymerase, N-terminal
VNSTLIAALAYAERGWPTFPCKPWPDKGPFTRHGFKDATCDPAQLRAWWSHWPTALIGVPTGAAIGLSVLDIDIKHNGFATFADDFGFATWPSTPTTHTPSGGAHLWFADSDCRIGNTTGKRGRGIGVGLDWRGTGGYVCVPPAGGYVWDPQLNFATVAPLPVPPKLLPRDPAPTVAAVRAVKPATGLSPYAEAALDSACRRILGAPDGEQHDTVRNESIAIGTLAGAGAIPAGFARDALLWAASRMPSYDPRRPWRQRDIERQVNESFDYGLARPRGDKNV